MSEAVKRERSERLIAVKNEVRDELLSEMVLSGKPLSVIVERRGSDGLYTAHSDTYVEIRFFSTDQNLTGNMLSVIPVSHKNGIITAKLRDNK